MADSYEKDEERQKLAEEAAEKSRSRKGVKHGVGGAGDEDDSSYQEEGADLDDGLGLDEDPEGGEVAPHGHGALHDIHDFYSAGQGAIDGHLQAADNDELKSLMNDHRDQLEAMSQEVRDLHQKNYPEHPHPEPYEADAMKAEDQELPDEVVEGGEEPLDEAVKSRTKKTRKSEDEEEEREEKSRTRKGRKGEYGADEDEHTKKSRTQDGPVLAAMTRKAQDAARLINEQADLIDEQTEYIAELESQLQGR